MWWRFHVKELVGCAESLKNFAITLLVLAPIANETAQSARNSSVVVVDLGRSRLWPWLHRRAVCARSARHFFGPSEAARPSGVRTNFHSLSPRADDRRRGRGGAATQCLLSNTAGGFLYVDVFATSLPPYLLYRSSKSISLAPAAAETREPGVPRALNELAKEKEDPSQSPRHTTERSLKSLWRRNSKW